MARLYDKLIAQGSHHPVWVDGKRIGPTQCGSVLAPLPVLVCDNVERYMMAVSEQDVWELGGDDFPNIAPPFNAFWAEYRTCNVINRNGVVERNNIRIVPCVGALVEYQRGWKFTNDDADPGHRVRAPGWSLMASVFFDMGSGGVVVGPVGSVAINVDERGRFIDDGPYLEKGRSGRFDRGIRVIVSNGERGIARFGQEWMDTIGIHVINCTKPILLAISFMHCKNVARTVVTPPAPLDKKWQKKHGKPLVRYHVLNIDPMREVLKHEGRSEETGLKKALHICRGHFATYTEAKPLFGKVTGTFWKPQHLRGHIEHGAVVKDYNVKAPRPRDAA